LLDACSVQFLLSDYEVNGRRHAVVRVLSLRIAQWLDVVEDVLRCVFPGQVGSAAEAFAHEEPEEAFCSRAIGVSDSRKTLFVVQSPCRDRITQHVQNQWVLTLVSGNATQSMDKLYIIMNEETPSRAVQCPKCESLGRSGSSIWG
jgi:hypothetical protein